jgi:hypothetical protein
MKIFYRAFGKALVLWEILIFSEFFEGFRKIPFLIQNSKSSNLKHAIFGHISNPKKINFSKKASTFFKD